MVDKVAKSRGKNDGEGLEIGTEQAAPSSNQAGWKYMAKRSPHNLLKFDPEADDLHEQNVSVSTTI